MRSFRPFAKELKVHLRETQNTMASSTKHPKNDLLKRVRESTGELGPEELIDWCRWFGSVDYVETYYSLISEGNDGDSKTEGDDGDSEIAKDQEKFHVTLAALQIASQSGFASDEPKASEYFKRENEIYRWVQQSESVLSECLPLDPAALIPNKFSMSGKSENVSDRCVLQLRISLLDPYTDISVVDSRWYDWVYIAPSFTGDRSEPGLFAARRFGPGSIIGCYNAVERVQGKCQGVSFPNITACQGFGMTKFDCIIRDEKGFLRFYRPCLRTTIHNPKVSSNGNSNRGLFMGVHYIHHESEGLRGNVELLPDGTVRAYKLIEIGSELIFGEPTGLKKQGVDLRMPRVFDSGSTIHLLPLWRSDQAPPPKMSKDSLEILNVALNGPVREQEKVKSLVEKGVWLHNTANNVFRSAPQSTNTHLSIIDLTDSEDAKVSSSSGNVLSFGSGVLTPSKTGSAERRTASKSPFGSLKLEPIILDLGEDGKSPAAKKPKLESLPFVKNRSSIRRKHSI